MKKLISLILALCLVLALAGCVGSTAPTKNNENKPTNGGSQSAGSPTSGTTKPKEEVTAYIDTVTTYNGEGTVTAVETYTYDAEGNQIAVVGRSPDGTQTYREVYTYENGLLIQKDRWYGPEDQKVSTVICAYNDQGLLVKETTYEVDGAINMWTEYIYDDQGKQIEIRQYGSENEFFARFTFEWRDDQIIKYLIYAEDGTVESEISYTYNDNGDVANYTHTYGNNYSTFYEHTYDNQGRLIKITVSSNGTPEIYMEYTYKFSPTGA